MFGEFNMVRSTILMFGVFAGSGLGVITTRHVAECRSRTPERLGNLIGLLTAVAACFGGVATLVCLVFARPLAVVGMNAGELAYALQVGCIIPLLGSVSGVQLGVIAGFESFSVVTLLLILDAIASSALLVVGAALDGVRGAVGGLSVAALLGFVVKQVALRRQCRASGIAVSYFGYGSELPELWKSALPGMLVGVVFYPFDWFSRLIISRQPGGFAEIGAFSAAYSLAQFVLFVPRQLAGPTVPIFANLLASGNGPGFRKVVRVGVASSIVAALLIALPLGLGADRILALYGKTFTVGAGSLLLLCGANTVWAASINLINAFFAFGRIWAVVIQHMVLGIGVVATTMFLRARGAPGLATGHLVGWCLLLAIQVLMLGRSASSRGLLGAGAVVPS
jgi:O-antigen/teichoic acid export membrane protein